MNAPDTHALIDAAIGGHADRLEQKVIEWRRHIHAHPELGNREFETAKLVAARALQKHDVERFRSRRDARLRPRSRASIRSSSARRL